MTILVIAEHDNKQLKPATLNTLTAAKSLSEKADSDIHVLVAGHECGSVAEAAAAIPCVAQVIQADSPALANQLAENAAPFLADLVKEKSISHVLAPSTSNGKNILPRAAASLDVAQVSDIIEVISADTFVHSIYAGNALETVKSNDPVKVATVRFSAFDPVEDVAGGSASIEKMEGAADAGIARFVSEELSVSDRPDLSNARIVISGGRGMKAKENFVLLEAVADKIGAAVGASRAAVDSGYVSNEMQVGQTGKIISPDLYIAVGISGAVQHLAGMKDSKVIVAINQDADAPIFNVADYGLVADLFTALPELEALLG